MIIHLFGLGKPAEGRQASILCRNPAELGDCHRARLKVTIAQQSCAPVGEATHLEAA